MLATKHFSPSLRYYGLPVVLLFLIALFPRFYLDKIFIFDGLYGQDAFAYYEYGRDVRHAIHDLRLPGPMFWPLGFPTLLAGVFSIFGQSPTVAYHTVLIMGALISPLTYLFAFDGLRLAGWSRSDSQRVGLIAAILTCFSGQLLQSSLVIMADIPSLFWVILSAWTLTRYARSFESIPHTRHRLIWISLAAITLGFATITRWLYGGLAFAWALFCILLWLQSPRPIRTYWKDACFAVIFGGLILIPQFLHSLENPASVVEHAWVQSWSPAHAFQKDFVNADGTFHYDQTIAEYYIYIIYHGWYIHALIAILILIGIAALLLNALRTTLSHNLFFILLLAWIAMTYGFLIGIPYQNVRFSLAFFIPLTIFAGIGFVTLNRLISTLSRSPHLKFIRLALQAFILIAVFVAAYTPYPIAKDALNQLIVRKNKDLDVVLQVEAILEPDATIYTLDLWPMMRHYSSLNTVQIFYEVPATIAQNLPTDGPTYVLLNTWAIENQWVGKIPWQNYHALRQNPGLEHLGRFSNYHLFRVIQNPRG